jgi:hypothetical protein
VLKRATQTLPRDRYQTVQEFWDDLQDASLPPTQPLHPQQGREENHPRATGKLNVSRELPLKAPPRPRFNVTRVIEQFEQRSNGHPRPRIVVPVANPHPTAPVAAQKTRQQAREIVAGMTDIRRTDELKQSRKRPESAPASRGLRALVAILLIVAFAGMLFATHHYFRARWSSASTSKPAASGPALIGRQGTIVNYDVYLRSGPNRNNPPVGVAEKGSVVQVLSVNDANNWYEVQILKHGRDKDDPDSADRGWLTKKYVELND